MILSTLQPEEDYIDGMIRVYNDEICDTIDNYNSSAYYEPSYVITRAYNNGGFKEQKTALGYVMDSYIHINVIWREWTDVDPLSFRMSGNQMTGNKRMI